MKKILAAAGVLIASLFVAVSLAYSAVYVTEKISDNAYDDWPPRINNNGHVVWYGWDGNDWEIYLYDGTGITQITDNSYNDSSPRINNNGHVVWAGDDGSDWEIYLYDGTGITNISDNTHVDRHPQINDNGYVTWEGYDGTDQEIYLYDGTGITRITDNAYYDYLPQINANGSVVWYGYDGSDWEIYLYDGTGITQITDNTHDDHDPRINNNGHVVWAGDDGSDWEIYLYDGTGITNISDNTHVDRHPQINDNGHVVWYGWDGSDWEVYLYDGTGITQITNNTYQDWFPRINDNGSVVWEGDDGNDSEIYLYDGTGITQITNTSSNHAPQINDNGYVTWYGGDGNDYEIYRAFPASLTVTSPNGGEHWNIGDTRTITWTSLNAGSDVMIELSRDGGILWETFIASTPNNGSYMWTVTAPHSAFCLMRVTSIDHPVLSDESDTEFVIIDTAAQYITVTSPNGGEVLPVGTGKNITWISSNAGELVTIELSRDGGTSWETITAGTPNDGLYVWTVTGPAAPVSVLKITSNDYPSISDQSDAAFRIDSALRSIMVTNPGGGETWRIGESQNITWTSLNAGAQVTIEMSRDGGSSWETITAGTPNNGLYAWTVTGPESSTCTVRVTSVDYPYISGENDTDFSIIEDRYLTLTSPIGGEGWIVGELEWITWESAGIGPWVTIEMSRDGGVTWSQIAVHDATDGSFPWVVTEPDSTRCMIRISGGGFLDMSDDYFTIAAERSITVTSPNGGESWVIGETKDITWTSVGAGDSVMIQISRDGGTSWGEYITFSTDNDGVYPWVVTGPESSECLIQVRSLLYGVSDTSDANYTITATAPADPVPDIKANGLDGPITVSSTETVDITVALDCNTLCSDDVDWWVVNKTPFGWYYYKVYAELWKPGFNVTYQGSLFDLKPYTVWYAPLLAGTYTIYFGVDTIMNGSLDMGDVYYDSVVVIVE